jgi:hypothetical protein
LLLKDCFGSEIYTEDFTEEFDFEKNLALFDKRLVFEEISASNQPDVIRLVPTSQNFFSPSPTARPTAFVLKNILTISGLYYKHRTIVNDDSSIISK